MTALRFQTGGDIRHPRPPFRGPVKKAQRLGHAGTIDTSVEFINTKYRKKDETGRVTGLGRRTREEIAKRRNQMTALRFQTGGETSDIPSLPSRGCAGEP